MSVMGFGLDRISFSISRYIGNNVRNLGNAADKLASGYQINKAGDDAARLAVSEKFRTQYYGLRQALENSYNGMSMLEVAEGGMTEIHNMLQRIRVLAVTSATDTLVSTDRGLIQTEVSSLLEGINQIASTTNYNGMRVLKEFSSENSLSFHLGANKDETKKLNIESISTNELGLNDLSITTREKSEEALGKISLAINEISRRRAKIGSNIHTLEPCLNPIAVSMERQVASETWYRDKDIAQGVMDFTKNKILLASSIEIVSKVNTLRKGIIDIIR